MENKEIIDNLLNRHSLTMDGIYTIMEKNGYIDGYQEGRDLSYYFKKDGKSKYFSNLSVVCEKAKEELSNLSIEDIEKIKMDLADIHEWGCIIQQEDEEDYGEVIAVFYGAGRRIQGEQFCGLCHAGILYPGRSEDETAACDGDSRSCKINY